ncbi:MAG TPA: hypothetical protein VN643_18745 [Pyrinomonadaceae bacterium]|nr:hypothetical protein [Pyrinomonadaceae bacterium]
MTHTVDAQVLRLKLVERLTISKSLRECGTQTEVYATNLDTCSTDFSLCAVTHTVDAQVLSLKLVERLTISKSLRECGTQTEAYATNLDTCSTDFSLCAVTHTVDAQVLRLKLVERLTIGESLRECGTQTEVYATSAKKPSADFADVRTSRGGVIQPEGWSQRLLRSLWHHQRRLPIYLSILAKQKHLCNRRNLRIGS